MSSWSNVQTLKWLRKIWQKSAIADNFNLNGTTDYLIIDNWLDELLINKQKSHQVLTLEKRQSETGLATGEEVRGFSMT
jgi:hypothetical protein